MTQPSGEPSPGAAELPGSGLVGQGDGSVLLLCRRCQPSRCLSSRVTTLPQAAALWGRHLSEQHGVQP